MIKQKVSVLFNFLSIILNKMYQTADFQQFE